MLGVFKRQIGNSNQAFTQLSAAVESNVLFVGCFLFDCFLFCFYVQGDLR